jgi:hypothetical protein
MDVSLEELRRAHATAVAVVTERSDGRLYVPVVLRLEQAIAERDASEDAYERIMRQAEAARAA